MIQFVHVISSNIRPLKNIFSSQSETMQLKLGRYYSHESVSFIELKDRQKLCYMIKAINSFSFLNDLAYWAVLLSCLVGNRKEDDKRYLGPGSTSYACTFSGKFSRSRLSSISTLFFKAECESFLLQVRKEVASSLLLETSLTSVQKTELVLWYFREQALTYFRSQGWQSGVKAIPVGSLRKDRTLQTWTTGTGRRKMPTSGPRRNWRNYSSIAS